MGQNIDFGNERGQNLANPKFDKDAVNLRTLRTAISSASADTIMVATAITESIQIIKEISVSLTALQIQHGNTTPIDTGIPLPGLGKAIEVVSASINFIANTTPFTSSTIRLITETALIPQASRAILDTGVSAFTKMDFNTLASTSIVENKRLLIQTDSDSIGIGDGTAKIYILYRIITV